MNTEKVTALQEKVASAEDDHYVLEWCTGLGKTRAAMMIAAAIDKRKGYKPWLIVVYRTKHKDTWTNEGYHGKFINYKSFNKVVVADRIIFDEAHHITPAVAQQLAKLNPSHTIVLSGTLPKDRLSLYKNNLIGSWYISKIKLSDAIKENYFKGISIITVEKVLHNTRDLVYKQVFKKTWPTQSVSYDEYKGIPDGYNYDVLCSEQEYLLLLEANSKYLYSRYLLDTTKFKKQMFFQSKLRIKNFLTRTKVKAAVRIIEMIRKEGYRVVAFADKVPTARLLNIPVIASEEKNSSIIVEQFNNRKIDAIASVDILNESSNLTDPDVIVILSINKIPIANEQRIGRGMRSKNPVIIIIYVPGTSDDENLKQMVRQYRSSTTNVKTLNQVRDELIQALRAEQ